MDPTWLAVVALLVGGAIAVAALRRRPQPESPVPFSDHPVQGMLRDGGIQGLPADTTAAWVDTNAGWVECRYDPHASVWRPLFGDAADATRVRAWLGDRGEELAIHGSGMLVAAAMVASAQEPAISDEGHAALGEAFTAVWREVAALGWTPAMPDGEGLLRLKVDSNTTRFAMKVAGHLEAAVRADLSDRAGADRRQLPSARLHSAAAALVAGIDPTLSLEGRAPRGVGPRQKEMWVVDEALAISLNNAPVNGVVQPLLVLRPAVLRGTHVLLEGVVA
jgi:hypothetical protein